MKNSVCRPCRMMILAVAASLAGCRQEADRPSPRGTTNNAPAVDLDAEISHATKTQRPLVVLITETEPGAADTQARGLLEDTMGDGPRDRVTPVLIDLANSRNRATAACFHFTEMPLLVCLSPAGVILSRDEPPITKDLVRKRIEQGVRLAPEVDKEFASLQGAVAKNANDLAAKLKLADFLIAHQNAREAIPLLAAVAASDAVEMKDRVRAWVELARAHFWVLESEKCRHVAKDLIATLGPKSPEAVAGGNLVLGLQEARSKRIALARREFAAAIAAAPQSVYAKQAAEAVAKLPTEVK